MKLDNLNLTGATEVNTIAAAQNLINQAELNNSRRVAMNTKQGTIVLVSGKQYQMMSKLGYTRAIK